MIQQLLRLIFLLSTFCQRVLGRVWSPGCAEGAGGPVMSPAGPPGNGDKTALQLKNNLIRL